MAASASYPSRQILGHFRVLEQLGAGGMGVVFHGHDEHLDRDVAIKVLPPGLLTDVAARRRFRREALALARLSHPNIATIHDFDSAGGSDFLIMEYVRGITLADKLRDGLLPENQIFNIAEQIAKALETAHRAGLVHCDLKPGNIMITATGEVKLLDFGVSLLVHSPTCSSGSRTLTVLQPAAGTPPYMAPEQLRGEPLDGRCDIYAVGVLLYELAAGHRPFDAKLSTNLVDDILHKPAVSPRFFNPRISAGLANIILKCLEKEPSDRYQSAKEVLVDLGRVATASNPALPLTVAVPSLWRGRVFVTVFIVLLVVFALLSLFVVPRWRALNGGGTLSARITSVAVLPLDNVSADRSQEYFTDGMTEELIGALAKISNLRVISRTSVMQYKGVRKPLPQIARELSVDGIIAGSVYRADSKRVRIMAELVDAKTDRNLWSGSYEGDLGDVFALQDEVARSIASDIRIQLTPDDQQALSSSHRVKPDAHVAYLQGRYHWNKGTEQEFRQAKRFFEQAADIDPNYAAAYAGLADYYWSTDELSPRSAKPKARQYVLKALALDETLADAHTALGAIHFFGEYDWSGAEKEFKRAIAFNRNDSNAHQMYAAFLAALGRSDEAVTEISAAQQLDPLDPATALTAGWIFYYGRKYDRTIEMCRKSLDLDSSFQAAHDCLGTAYTAKHDYQNAITECQLAAKGSANDPVRLVGLGRAYALAGKKAQAVGILRQVRASTKVHYVPPYFFAQIDAALGNKNQAFSWLEKAYQEHDSYLTRLKADDAMDPLRSDPRFAKLLQRMKM